MEQNITLQIDNHIVEVAKGTTILEAAAAAGVEIPTLCYLREANQIGSCRMCVVEADGVGRLLTACNTLVKEGMNVNTKSGRVISARRMILDLLLANH